VILTQHHKKLLPQQIEPNQTNLVKCEQNIHFTHFNFYFALNSKYEEQRNKLKPKENKKSSNTLRTCSHLHNQPN
jgi:hypothetical protein